MNNYLVEFTYTVEIQAEDDETAADIAFDTFAAELPTLSAGEFAQHDAHENLICAVTE